MLHRKENETIRLEEENPVFSGSFAAGKGWKKITLNTPAEGQYFCLEALNSQNKDDVFTSVAEIEIMGADGKSISKAGWKTRYADSEEISSTTNNSADKVFDNQESTFWHTRWSGKKTSHPHQLVIDLGNVVKVTGFRYLTRTDNSDNGMIKDYKVYIKKGSFKFQ
jgi:beta-galactosidase